jgi:hypothetical protein
VRNNRIGKTGLILACDKCVCSDRGSTRRCWTICEQICAATTAPDYREGGNQASLSGHNSLLKEPNNTSPSPRDTLARRFLFKTCGRTDPQKSRAQSPTKATSEGLCQESRRAGQSACKYNSANAWQKSLPHSLPTVRNRRTQTARSIKYATGMEARKQEKQQASAWFLDSFEFEI